MSTHNICFRDEIRKLLLRARRNENEMKVKTSNKL